MLRGCELIFTAIWAIVYRHKKLVLADWLGVILAVTGVVVVGISALLTEPHSAVAQTPASMQLLAMVLILTAMGLAALQTVLEEELLQDVDATASELVSYEGIWGVYFTTFMALPLANILPENAGEGLFEHSLESFSMLGTSLQLLLLWIAFVVVVFAYNLSGLALCAYTSAINRTIYESMRAITVWVLSVAVNSIWEESGGGERLTKMSAVQGLGFVVMVMGSFVYNRVLKLPDCGGSENVLAIQETLLKEDEGEPPETVGASSIATTE
jgi:drug/metabolite transporter (DMT)-like permease